MGISLEYGHSSPISQRASDSSHSFLGNPSYHGREHQKPLSVSPQPHGNFDELVAPWRDVSDYEDQSIEIESTTADGILPIIPLLKPNPNLTIKSVTDGPLLPQESQHGAQSRVGHHSSRPVIFRPTASAEDVLEFTEAEHEMPVLQSALSRPPLLAILDRWRNASKNEKSQKASSSPLSDHTIPPAPDAGRLEEPHAKIPMQQKRSPKVKPSLPPQKEPSAEADVKQRKAPRLLMPASAAHPRLIMPRGQEYGTYGDYAAMLYRAGRAREIYLASRTFNHWAERTAARLEKEAVARRHMIRFRCFRGWSNAPNSKAPVVDHLRAATAVQKLRRAVACQEEQLRAAASVINKAHRTQKAKRVLCQWICSTAQQNIRHATAQRAKRGVVRSWSNVTILHQRLAESTAQTRQDNQKRQLIHRWASKAQQAGRQLSISRHVGLVRPMFAHLAAWWDYAEVEKRAEVYRANLIWRRAHSVLDNWNLRARAQACVWRSDYQSATCALNKWNRAIGNGQVQQRCAAFVIERCKVSTTLSRAEHFVDYMSKLESYAYRARLFIMASKFLRVLDHAHEARKASRREEIRQQLRVRYKQVSSARKKRQFHSALKLWRSSAQRHASIAVETMEHVELHEHTLKLDAVSMWLGAASQHEEQRAAGQRYALRYVLSSWAELSDELVQQDTQSWDMWMQRKQWQALKSWSISSLQGSGRAHTAAMVQQRHEADQRNRAFQLWRYSSRGAEATDAKYNSTTPHHPTLTGRRTSKTIFSRKSSARHESGYQDLRGFNAPAAPLETPTRWTGRPLTVPSVLAKSMPPVREADEQSATASNSSDEAEIGYNLAANTKTPQQGLHRSLVLRPGKMASTTPRAPLPPMLRRNSQDQNPALNTSTISTVSKGSFYPGRSLTGQQETGAKQVPGYVSSTIQTSLPAKLGSLSQRTPTLNWRGPATPSRQSTESTAGSDSRVGPPKWLNAARAAPQPTRFAGSRRGG